MKSTRIIKEGRIIKENKLYFLCKHTNKYEKDGRMIKIDSYYIFKRPKKRHYLIKRTKSNKYKEAIKEYNNYNINIT